MDKPYYFEWTGRLVKRLDRGLKVRGSNLGGDAFFLTFQTGYEAQQANYTMGTGSFPLTSMVVMLIYIHSAYEQTTTILRIIISKIKTSAIQAFRIIWNFPGIQLPSTLEQLNILFKFHLSFVLYYCTKHREGKAETPVSLFTA